MGVSIKLIRLVIEDADKYFISNSQLVRKLETIEILLKSNAKIIISTGTELVNVIRELAGVLPLNKKGELSKIEQCSTKRIFI